MRTILPIFWTAQDPIRDHFDDRAFIGRFFETVVCATGPESVFVFTDSQEVRNLAERMALTPIRMRHKIASHTPAYLPVGGRESIDHLELVFKAEPDESLILNFRNPLIAPQTIRTFIQTFRTARPPVLMSGVVPVDHPCQLYRNYCAQYRFVHFLDARTAPFPYLERINRFFPGESASGKFCLSKPFHFDWEAANDATESPSGLYIPVLNEMFVPVRNPVKPGLVALEKIPGTAPPSLFWIRETSQTARILFQLPRTTPGSRESLSMPENTTLEGVAFNADYSGLSSRLFKQTGASEFYLINESHQPQAKLLKSSIVLLDETGAFQDDFRELEPGRSLNRFPLRIRENSAGLVQTDQTLAHGPSFDRYEPFPPPEGLWKYENGRLINCLNGNPILGRQDFPDIFQPDGSLLMLQSTIVDFLDQTIAQGRAEGFWIKQEQSIQIRTKLDWLKYQILSQADPPAGKDASEDCTHDPDRNALHSRPVCARL